MPLRGARQQAVQKARIDLRVQGQASASLSMEALRLLAVGDVLMLDRQIGDAWTLANATGWPLVSCNIGRSGARRALTIFANKEPTNVRR
jgi:flagellar motor switch protein FliM